MQFTFADLGRFLADTAARCRVRPFRAWDGGAALLLRHDIDVDVPAAMRVAAVEERADVRSTFFFLPDCPHYNLQAPAERAALRDLVARGFEVGLHFDPLAAGEAGIDEDEAAMEQRARREAAWLSELCGAAVASISIHNPSIHGRYPMFGGFRNAYDPVVFADGRYVSDSRMQFGGDLDALVERAAAEPCQLLLHPIHFSEDGAGYAELIARVVLERTRALDTSFRRNTVYDATVQPELEHHVARLAAEKAGTASATTAGHRP